MTANIHFFPLGNADTLLMNLADGRKILVDYADMRNPDDAEDIRCDLPSELLLDLRKSSRSYYDAVCITHVDMDHCKGFGEFFWLEHAKRYQGSGRIEIKELWVPAAAVLEKGLEDDARLVRAEARHRLKEGRGVLVFSRPERLKKWMEKAGLDPASRNHLIVDAGLMVPRYGKEGPERAEFFIHSPFAWRDDKEKAIDRNDASVVMQVTFREGDSDFRLLLGADIDQGIVSEIVKVTRKHSNDDRLTWDLMKLFHHCSYLSLGPERGTDETKPELEVKWLFEEQGHNAGVMVSTSWPIPAKGSKKDKGFQPPHSQAANYYRRIAELKGGQFVVTMEEPSKAQPKPFGYEITSRGVHPIVDMHP